MFFEVKDVKNNKLTVYSAKTVARQYILLCKKGVEEQLLDRYLAEHYKTLLVPACLTLVNRARYSFDNSGSLIITFPTKKLDNLASLITFGTGKIHGSQILRRAFGQL